MPKHRAYDVALGDLDIAVIDDNRATRQTMRAALESLGVARVRLFDGGGSVLDELAADAPHLVMLEWGPRGDGEAALKAIRARAGGPLSLASVIAVSGEESEEMARRAFLAGANQVLFRPVAPTTVLGRLVWLQGDGRELVAEGENYVVDGAGGANGDRAPELAGTARRAD